MTQYIAKSTLISDGERYQQGQVFSEVELKGLSPELVDEHFKEIVTKTTPKSGTKNQATAEINDETGNGSLAPTGDNTKIEPQNAPAPKQVQGRGGKGKGKGKGGK